MINKISETVIAVFDKTTSADPLHRRVARGAIWSLLSAIVTQGSNLATAVISARILGPVEFGQLSLITSTIGMFGIFAGFGLGVTATKYVAEYRKENPRRAGEIIGFSTIMAVGTGLLISISCYVCAPYLATTTLGGPQLADELRIGSLLLLLNAFNGTQFGALAGFEAFKAIATINLVRFTLALPLATAGVFCFGLSGALWGQVLSLFIACSLSQHFLRQKCLDESIVVRFDQLGKEANVLLVFSLPAVLGGAVAACTTWGTNAMLANSSNGLREMAVFSAANHWRAALLFMPGLLGQVVLPIFSSLQGRRSETETLRVLKGSIIANGIATVPVFLLLFPLANGVMSLYGPEFRFRGDVLRVALLSAGLQAIQTPVGNLINAAGSMWTGFLMNSAWAICMFVSTYLFLKRGWGAEALVAAYVIAYACHTIWTFGYVAKGHNRTGTFCSSLPSGGRKDDEFPV